MNTSTVPPSETASHASLAWIGQAPGQPLPWVEVVTLFEDSDDFLLSPRAFDFDFYVVHLAQRGVGGLDLVRLIRRRSAAGMVAISQGESDAFVAALDSGADMVLVQAAPADHLRAAMAAVQRRLHQEVPEGQGLWTLLEQRSVLLTPDATQIPLSDSDLAIMRCFAAAKGGRVERRTLIEHLWGPSTESMDNALHATLYRLRKRIEQSGKSGRMAAPIHAVSRVGYEFRAPLMRS